MDEKAGDQFPYLSKLNKFETKGGGYLELLEDVLPDQHEVAVWDQLDVGCHTQHDGGSQDEPRYVGD